MSTVPTLQIHVNATEGGLDALRLKVAGLRSEVAKLDLDSPLAKLRKQMANDISVIKNQLLNTLPLAAAGGVEAFKRATEQATERMAAVMEEQTRDLVEKVAKNGKRVLSEKQKQDAAIAESNRDAIKSGAFIKSTPTSQLGMVNKALGALSEGADAEAVLKRYNSRVMEAVYNLPAFVAANEKAAAALKSRAAAGQKVETDEEKRRAQLKAADADGIKNSKFADDSAVSRLKTVRQAFGALQREVSELTVIKRFGTDVLKATKDLAPFEEAVKKANAEAVGQKGGPQKQKSLDQLKEDNARLRTVASQRKVIQKEFEEANAAHTEKMSSEDLRRHKLKGGTIFAEQKLDLDREAQQQAMRVRDAKFSDMSARQQLQQVRGVAAQIRKGVSEENIAKAFAPSAIAGVSDLAGFVQRAEDFRNANKKIKDTSVSDAKKADDLLQAQRDKNRAFENLDAEQRLALAEKVAASRKALNSEAFVAKKYAPLAVEAANDLPATRLKAEEFRAAQEQVKRLKALDDDRLRDLQRAGRERLAQEIKDAADVKALRKSQEREYDADARKNNSFRNATPATQLKTLTRARSELELGASEASVLKNYGSQVFENTKNIHAFEAATLKGSSALKGMTLDMNDAHAAARGLAGGFGQLWLTYGNLIPLVSGAAVAYSFKTSVQAGAEFVESLYVIGELAGNTTAEVAKLSSAALELGRTTQYGPLEAAKGMEILALAGLKASEVLSAIKPTLDFASAGGVNADKAAETLVAVSTAYGYTASQFSIVADIIAKSAAESMASVSNMSEAFKSSSVVAQQYGVTLEDMSKNLMFLAQIGITGSAAGTSVRNMYSELAKGSGKVADALAKVGVDAQSADGKMKPIVETMQQLVLATAQMDGKSANSFFQTISNERGGKDLAANVSGVYKIINDNQARMVALGGEGTKTVYDTVEALRAQGKQVEANALVTKTINDAFTEMKAKQEEMGASTAGFSYFAALEKKLTPISQFKTILASLQTDFVEAFTGAEASVDGSSRAIYGAQDGLFLLGTRLREITNSEGFRQFIADMVGGLTSFISAVVSAGQWISEHGQALKTLALFYGTYIAATAAAGLVASALTLTVAAFTPAATAAAAGVGLLTAAKTTLATVTSGVLASSLAGSVVSYYAVAAAAAAARGATLAFNLAVVTFGISAVVAAGYATYLGLRYLFVADSAEEAAERKMAANEKEKASELDKLKTASEANKARIEQTLEQVRSDNQKYERLEELRIAGIAGQIAEAKVAGESAEARIRAEIAVSEQIAKTTKDTADALISKKRGVLEFMSFLEPFLPGFDKSRASLEAESAKVQAEYEAAIAKAREQGGASLLATWSEFERKMEIERAKVAQAKKDAELSNKRLTGTGTFTPAKEDSGGGERAAKAGYGRMLSAANDFYTSRKKTLDDAFSQEITDIKAQVRARELTEGAGYARSLVASANYESEQRALIKTTYESRVAGLVKLYAELPAKGKEREGALEVWVQELKKAETQFDETSKQLDQLSASRQKAAGYDLANKISDENKALDDLSASLAVYLEQLKLKSVADTAAAGATAAQRAAMEASAGVNAKFADDLAKHEKAAQKAAESVLDLQIQMALLAVESDLAGKALPEVYAELQGKLDKTLQGMEQAREKLGQFKVALASGAETAGQEASSKTLVAEYDKANTEIKDKLSGAIFDAATSGGKGLKDQLKKAVLDFSRDKFKLAMDVILNPVSKALTSFLSPAAAQAAGFSEGGGGGGGLFSAGKGIYDALNGGFSKLGASVTSQFSSFATSSIGQSMGLSSAATVGNNASAFVAPQMTSAASSMATAAGSLASAAGGALAGVAIGSAIAGDKVVLGLSGKSSAAIGAALGLALTAGNPIGAAIGGAIAGTVNAAFGMGPKNTTAEGLSGKFGASAGSELQTYSSWQQKGGWFRSDKSGTDYAPVQEALDKFLDLSIVTIASKTKAYAAAVGAGAEAVSGYTEDINVSLKGLTADEQNKALDEAVSKFGDNMALQVEGLSKYVREGESASAVLEAMANALTTVNSAFGVVNLTLYESTLWGAEASSKLLAAFGGAEKFTSGMNSYYENYFSAEEKRANTIKGITKTLNAAGGNLTEQQISSMSKKDFRTEFEKRGNTEEYLAALISVESVVANLNPELESLEQALLKLTNPIRTIEEIAQSLFSLGQESANLQADLMEAKGDKAGAGRARANLETQNLSDAEITLYRYNQGLKAQIEVAKEATSLQERLTAATDTAAQAAAKARDAIDPLNRSLYDSAIAAEKAKEVAAEAKGLQDQLNAARDTEVEAIERQRKALDSSNQALFDQLQAQLKINKAKEEEKGLLERLYGATDTAAQAADRARKALDPLNRALFDTVTAAEASKVATDSFNANIAGTVAKFNTPEQNRKDQYSSIANNLRASGLVRADYSNLSQDLQSATKEEIKKSVQALFDGLGAGSAVAKEKLRVLADQLADMKTAEAEEALKTAAETTKANLEKLAASLARFGAALNLRIDLEGASRTALGTVKTIQSSYTAAADGLQNLRPFADTYATRLAGIALTTTDALSSLFSSVNSGSFAADAKELEEELAKTGQGIGKNLAISGLSKYFTDFGSDLTSLVASLSTALADGSSRLASGLIDSQGMLRGTATTPGSLGLSATGLTGSGAIGIAKDVGSAATLIGKTLSDSLLASVSENIKGNSAFSDLLGPDLARLSAIISGVAKDDVQGLNDAFLLLTGNFAEGKLNSSQYNTAIGLVNSAFKNSTASIETVSQAYLRLTLINKTNEQIAQERISLEERYYAATDTTSQALDRARAKVDPLNQSFYDTLIAAEGAKSALQERISLEDRLYAATGNTAAAAARARNAIDPLNRSFYDTVIAAEKAKGVLEERKGLLDQLNTARDTESEALARQKAALDPSNQSLFEFIQAQLAINKVNAEYKTLEEELISLKETETEAVARQRSAISSSNVALFDQIQAQKKANAVSSEKKTLEEQLISVTDTAAQALTRQRNALDESNRTLFDQIQLQIRANEREAEKNTLQERLNAASDTTAEAAARARNAIDPLNRSFYDTVIAAEKALEQTNIGKGLGRQLLELQQDTAALRLLDIAGMNDANVALYDRIQAFKTEKTAREAAKEAAAKGASDAFSALQRAVDAQKKIVQVARDAAAESVTEIISVFDILKSSVKELYGTVDSTAKLQADQGRAFISQALATAQSTGYLPESKALTDAINAAKGDSREFASQFEKDFATLTLAGDLSLLEALSKTQLTAAEQALKFQDDQLLALDNALTLAQKQIDAANGVDTSVKSVESAVGALSVALGIQRGATGAGGALTPATASPWAGASESQIQSGYSQMYDGIDIGKAKADQLRVTDLWMLSPAELSARAGTGGIPANILELRQDAIFGSGASSNGAAWLDVLAKAAGAGDDYLQYANSKFSAVPQYEIGTNYVPSDGLAYLHQGEAVVPRAYNPAAGGTVGGNDRLESLVEGLTAEVKRLQGIVDDGNKSNQRILETLNEVTEGGSNMRITSV